MSYPVAGHKPVVTAFVHLVQLNKLKNKNYVASLSTDIHKTNVGQLTSAATTRPHCHASVTQTVAVITVEPTTHATIGAVQLMTFQFVFTVVNINQQFMFIRFWHSFYCENELNLETIRHTGTMQVDYLKINVDAKNWLLNNSCDNMQSQHKSAEIIQK